MTRTLNPETRQTAIARVMGASVLALTLLLGAKAALAETACASDEALSKQLEHRYAESPIARGLASSGKLLQVFASEDGGSWTVVITQPDGMSCVTASGRFWQTVTKKVLGPEA